MYDGAAAIVGGDEDPGMMFEDCYGRVVLSISINGNAGGGLMAVGGHTGYGSTFTRCYCSASINSQKVFVSPLEQGNTYYNENTVSNCYYNKTLFTSTSDAAKITKAKGLTTEQFADESNFEGWDFENTWIIKDGYPELRVFLKD